MNKQIVRMLASYDAAENARKQLVAEGFDKEGIDISVTIDEAGPGEGNFYVGDSPEVKGGTDYKDVFAPGEHRGNCVMTVIVADAAQLARAASILDHNGALDIDAARNPPNRT